MLLLLLLRLIMGLVLQPCSLGHHQCAEALSMIHAALGIGSHAHLQAAAAAAAAAKAAAGVRAAR
jgi:hypothetical protein